MALKIGIIVVAVLLLIIGFPEDKSSIDKNMKDTGASSITGVSGFLSNTATSNPSQLNIITK